MKREIQIGVFEMDLQEALVEIRDFIKKGGKIDISGMISVNRFVKDPQIGQTCGYFVVKKGEEIIEMKMLPEDGEILAPFIKEELEKQEEKK